MWRGIKRTKKNTTSTKLLQKSYNLHHLSHRICVMQCCCVFQLSAFTRGTRNWSTHISLISYHKHFIQSAPPCQTLLRHCFFINGISEFSNYWVLLYTYCRRETQYFTSLLHFIAFPTHVMEKNENSSGKMTFSNWITEVRILEQFDPFELSSFFFFYFLW